MKRKEGLIVGIVLILVGILGLLLDIFWLNKVVLEVIIVLGGLFLLRDAYLHESGPIRNMSFLIGVLVVLLGLIPLMVEYRLFGFLTFMPMLNVKETFLELVLIVYGGYLVFDNFM